jgi:hypothetical protein
MVVELKARTPSTGHDFAVELHDQEAPQGLVHRPLRNPDRLHSGKSAACAHQTSLRHKPHTPQAQALYFRSRDMPVWARPEFSLSQACLRLDILLEHQGIPRWCRPKDCSGWRKMRGPELAATTAPAIEDL